MQDLQTKSLWSQVTGECISGSMEGTNLSLVSAAHTTFSEFEKNYPDGVMLKKEEKGSAESSYNKYFDDPEKLGIFGRPNSYNELDGKDLVFGLRLDDRELAVSTEYLSRNRFLAISDNSVPIVITYNLSGKTAAAFSLNGIAKNLLPDLKIEDGKIIITGTNTEWDADTGKIVSGNGKDLDLYPLITSYWFAWISFFPDTELVK